VIFPNWISQGYDRDGDWKIKLDEVQLGVESISGANRLFEAQCLFARAISPGPRSQVITALMHPPYLLKQADPTFC
jgi:hypothetical protein